MGDLPLDHCLAWGCAIEVRHGRRVCARPTCGIDHGQAPRALTEAEKREQFFAAFAGAVHAGARVVESPRIDRWIVMPPTSWSPQWVVVCPEGEAAAVLRAIDEARSRAAEQAGERGR